MLNRRAHILFEAEDYQLLEAEAEEKDSSVGELVRLAVKRVYVEPKSKQLSDREKAFEALKKLQLQTRQKGRVDYKELIEYGRKY
ncbi:MAG: hypothetical protein U0946_04670 [Patescibacteria group bacterium]|nr:hypothetical protein [Patescibacteria group bacterium]